MHLPPQTKDVFQYLIQGQFLSSNHPSPTIREWYTIVHKYADQLSDYFLPLGYQLESGLDFYYFSQLNAELSLDQKLEKTGQFIDWLGLAKSLDPAFGPGFRFEPQEMIQKCQESPELKQLIRRLPVKGSAGESIPAKFRIWLKSMENEGFIAFELKWGGYVRVLSAFYYLEQLVHRIEIR